MKMRMQCKEMHIDGFERNDVVNKNRFHSFGTNERIIEIRSAA